MKSWVEIRPLADEQGLSRRVAERAAWHAIVRERLGADVAISYNKNGAPVIDGGAERGHISISHTKSWVAVIWSPKPCAIDIELRNRKLSAGAAARYNISSIEDWCALEARYKYAGLTNAAPPAIRFLSHPDLVVAVYVEDGAILDGVDDRSGQLHR